MIKIISLFVSLVITSTLFGQTFEGKITYRNSYKSKMPNVTDQQFTSMMGDTQEYSIKGGDYKSVANGTFLQWQQYVNADNKLYTKMATSDAILWNDGSINQDEVLEAKLNKGVTTILGYSCDELILRCKSGIQKFYFNSQLAVDPKSFEKHKYGNWHEFIFRSKALPLKFTIDNGQFTLESAAVEVKPMQLDMNIFLLPKNITTQKSPY